MKKLLILTLTLTCLLFCSCGGNEPSEPAPETNPPETTAVEALNTREKQLFDALIKIITSDFYAPTEVRVLEIGDETYRAHRTDAGKGTDTITVRLQGENRAGGKTDEFLCICIVGGTPHESRKAQVEKDRERYGLYMVIKDEADAGEYYSYSSIDYYKFFEPEIITHSTECSVANINRALAAYWADMGL
ncbi:MAG: hypothetical protein IJZ08_00790 [Clostridia bacterium]|nr:hypothetical protein [Clostridia bacterium]